MMMDVFNQVIPIFGGLSGIVSITWQVYDKILARPKLKIRADDIRPRLDYTPGSWAWIPRYARKAGCNPYGTVLSIPVVNKGRRMAANCRAKMRFRSVELIGDKYKPGDWSRWFELHWADNPEDRLDAAYQPITIGVKDEVYIDLIVYHTRNPERAKMKIASKNGVIIESPKEVSGCILTFYAKPFLRAPLTEDPCKGEPPTIEYLKPPLQTFYEVQLRVVCDNAQAEATLYTIILNRGTELAIHAWPALDQVKQALQKGLDKIIPIYSYQPTKRDSPPPCNP